jgi:hypothetical protein
MGRQEGAQGMSDGPNRPERANTMNATAQGVAPAPEGS